MITGLRLIVLTYVDHLERRFDVGELVGMVRRGTGLLVNNSPEAIKNSFKLVIRDDRDRRCEIIVVFARDGISGAFIIVCSAYREI